MDKLSWEHQIVYQVMFLISYWPPFLLVVEPFCCVHLTPLAFSMIVQPCQYHPWLIQRRILRRCNWHQKTFWTTVKTQNCLGIGLWSTCPLLQSNKKWEEQKSAKIKCQCCGEFLNQPRRARGWGGTDKYYILSGVFFIETIYCCRVEL